MKLTGALMILCCGVLAGCSAARNLEQKAADLRLLRQMVTAMMQELSASLPLTGDLIRHLAEMQTFRTLRFLQQAAQDPEAFPLCWFDAVEHDRTLSPESAEVLCGIGQTLGSTALDGQLAALSLALERLSVLQSDAENTAVKKGNLYRSLGILGAIFAAILLL